MMKLIDVLKEDLQVGAIQQQAIDYQGLLSKLDSIDHPYEKQLFLIDQGLEQAGKGSYRVVYRFGPGKVLKLANSISSIKDNKNEWDLFNCSGPDFLAEIYDHAADFSWLVCEEADQFKTPNEALMKLKAMTGFKFINLDVFAATVTNGMIQGHRLNPLYTQLKAKSTWFKGFAETMEQCEISAHDFNEDNLGLRRSNGRLIVIDYGFKTNN